MTTFFVGLAGLLLFAAGTAILGTWLRTHPSKSNAEKSSRVMHFLFFASWGIPSVVALFYPGWTHMDEALGLSPLPLRPLFLVLGIILLVPGFYLAVITNKVIRALGSGANAFRLTKRMVAEGIYARSRNPMSLGFYLLTLGFTLVLGSTSLTLGVLLGLIPSHLFFLKYFEEKELELRFGETYLEYRRRVPFLAPALHRIR